MDTTLEIVLPVLNEERGLALAVDTLSAYLTENLDGFDWRIVIADNGSTDSTPTICHELSQENNRVAFMRLSERGRGRALKQAWAASDASIVGYMDVDLSTRLDALPALVNAVHNEGYDIAIGSRLSRGSQVVGRPIKRELISRAYSLLVRAMFWTGFVDPQCGFKVLNLRTARSIVGVVMDPGWFFDSEMLIVAEKNGYRIKEVPIHWTDDPDSRVDVLRTAYRDIKGLLRLRTGGLYKASRKLSGGQ